MAVLAEKTRTRRTSVKQKTNFSKNGLNDGLNAESSQKLLFYLLEKMDKLDNKLDQKVDKLDEKIDRLENKLDNEVGKLNEKIDNRFLWTIGIMFTGFIGMITIILSKF